MTPWAEGHSCPKQGPPLPDAPSCSCPGLSFNFTRLTPAYITLVSVQSLSFPQFTSRNFLVLDTPSSVLRSHLELTGFSRAPHT